MDMYTDRAKSFKHYYMFVSPNKEVYKPIEIIVGKCYIYKRINCRGNMYPFVVISYIYILTTIQFEYVMLKQWLTNISNSSVVSQLSQDDTLLDVLKEMRSITNKFCND